MKNYHLYNNALRSDRRLGYTSRLVGMSILNKMSTSKKTVDLELYVDYIIYDLGVSERQIRRCLKELEECGYFIIKRPSTPKSHLPNLYTLVEQSADKSADKMTPLTNRQINKYNNNTSNIDINYTIEKEKLNKKKKDWMTSSYQSVLKTTDFSQVENKEFKKRLESISRNETQIQKTSPMIRSGIYDTVIKHIEHCIGLLQCGVITQEEYNKYLDYFYV